MLNHDPDIRFLDTRHLHNWWSLALPPGLAEGRRYAILILEKGKLVHAIRSGEGAIDVSGIGFAGTGRSKLLALRNELGVEGLLAIERDALATLLESMEAGLRLHEDLPRQGIGLWQALRKSEGIYSQPALLDLIPPLRADALQKTFNLLVPDPSCVLVYVVDEPNARVHCSVLAVKRKGSIEAAYMHPVLADQVSERELCRDFRQNYDRINRAAESRLARPSISVFIELGAVERILTGPADQLATEIKARNLIIDPAPAWLQGLLGGAAVAAIAQRNARRVARFLPEGARKMAGELAGAAQDRLKDSAAHPFALLGFDPIELLHTLRGFYSAGR